MRHCWSLRIVDCCQHDPRVRELRLPAAVLDGKDDAQGDVCTASPHSVPHRSSCETHSIHTSHDVERIHGSFETRTRVVNGLVDCSRWMKCW